jgi:hypothetical protein
MAHESIERREIERIEGKETQTDRNAVPVGSAWFLL